MTRYRNTKRYFTCIERNVWHLGVYMRWYVNIYDRDFRLSGGGASKNNRLEAFKKARDSLNMEIFKSVKI